MLHLITGDENFQKKTALITDQVFPVPVVHYVASVQIFWIRREHINVLVTLLRFVLMRKNVRHVECQIALDSCWPMQTSRRVLFFKWMPGIRFWIPCYQENDYISNQAASSVPRSL